MRRPLLGVTFVCCCVLLFATPAAAHGGYYGSGADTTIPTWLTAGTGGAVVVFSFLGSTAVADEDSVQWFQNWRRTVRVPAAVRHSAEYLGRGVGVLALLGVLAVGLFGPASDAAAANAAIVVVWAGWWAGYTASVYLAGNSWPWLNPWRTLAHALPTVGDRSLPDAVGVWPSVAGLLALVWVETVSPIATNPRLLAAAVLGYTAVTLAGASVLGPAAWFERVDPVSRVFHWYGRLAPVQRTDAGVSVRVPAFTLAENATPDTPGDVAFVVALLWGTTFDGLVTTPVWADVARAAVSAGVPEAALSLGGLLAGFGVFLAAYRRAADAARETASTYVTSDYVGRWFAPALLPIAAGYHLAHYAGYLITRLPAVVHAVTRPFSLVTAPVIVLPEYFGLVQVAFVVVGHLVGVWIAHSRAIDLFPGAVKPIRSQYPFVLVMSAFTTVSVWIVSQPYVRPA